MGTAAMSNYIRILLIEDCVEDAELLELDLRLAGYDFVLVRIETESELRASLLESEWDVVIADYNLPQFSGMQALEICQSTGLDIPFILMSGYVGEDVAAEAMAHGVHDYIMKDNRVRLIPAIERELREARIRHEKREVEGRFRSLFEAMTEGVILYEIERDPSGVPVDYRILDMNPASRKQLAMSMAECRGESVNFLFGDATPLVRNAFFNVISRMKPDSFELFYPPTRRQFHLCVSQAGKGILATVLEDITERKRAELDLQRELRLNAACANLSGALIAESESLERVASLVLDHALSLTYSRKAWVSLFDPRTQQATLYGKEESENSAGNPPCQFTLDLEREGAYPEEWAPVLRAPRSALLNEFSSRDLADTLSPSGYSLHRLLVVPVTIGCDLVGQIVVANAATDYTEHELDAVRRLAEVYALALERNRFYEVIRERTRRIQFFWMLFPVLPCFCVPRRTKSWR
jgi:CheY-like chemotaxis protein